MFLWNNRPNFRSVIMVFTMYVPNGLVLIFSWRSKEMVIRNCKCGTAYSFCRWAKVRTLFRIVTRMVRSYLRTIQVPITGNVKGNFICHFYQYRPADEGTRTRDFNFCLFDEGGGFSRPIFLFFIAYPLTRPPRTKDIRTS